MAEMVSSAPAAASGKKLYARKSSGLVRTIGVFGAMVFGVHCISLSSSGLIPFSWVAGVWPGSSIIGVLTVAMFFCLFHAYTYAVIGATMPRSAADYTLASRTLSAPLAFAASWTLVIFSAMVAGSLIAWIPKTALPVLFRTMGIVMGNQSFVDFANWSVSPLGIVLIGTICTIITFVLMIMPTRTILRILEVGFFLGILAWVILYFQLGTAARDSFPAAWDKFMGAGSFAARIDLAKANGMVINPNVGVMTLAGLIMGFWIFYGYYIPTFFAGEVKQAESTLITGSWASLIVTWAIFVVAAILLLRLVPADWIAAESYLSNAGIADANPMPWITFYAAILQPNIVLLWIVALAWVYTLINLAQTYFFYCSRIIFAWSFDRLIPEKVCYIHPTLNSPIVAISIITLIAEIGVLDASGWLWPGSVMGAQLNFVFFAACTMLVPVTAITLFPFTKPDLFENASAFVKRKIGNVPVITIVGAITFLFLLWLIVASFVFPAVGGRIQVSTLGTLFGFIISGLVVFYAARAYRMNKEGIDINWTFQSVPPIEALELQVWFIRIVPQVRSISIGYGQRLRDDVSERLMKMTRILYGSDFHGSEAVFRKFLASGLQYKVNALMVGGDVTGKAMLPIIHQGGGKYSSHLFGADKVAATPDELEALKKSISNVGFYPIVLEKDEAAELENDPARMGARFEQEMCNRVRDWMKLAEEKLVPQHITLYFMAGNDDLYSIDKVVDEFEHIRNPDMKCFEMEGGYSVVGLSNANMTPWRCARDVEEPELAAKLDILAGMIRQPERTIAIIHVPPFSSGLDTCPELDKNLKIVTQGGQVVMKAAGSPAVRAFIEKVQPMLTLHGHIHESPGHVRNGRTLMINAGSEYAEGIMKAAIVNLEDGKVKGHLLVSA